MPKLEITLKQHTPMIHFQHDQAGATLRATELKPKLDKFLIKYVFNDSKEKYKEYLINGTEKALNYKVKISSEGWRQGEIQKYEKEYDAYFGDLPGLTLCDSVTLCFFSYDKELLKNIEKILNPFFAVTNFGTRQNKGFGSFYPEGAEYEFEKDFKEFFKDRLLFEKHERTEEQCLIKINKNYNSMKSGLNGENSFLVEYSKTKNFSGEKKLTNMLSKGYVQNVPGNEKYLRAMLGLAENYSYDNGNTTVTIKSTRENDEKIDRFKSPITFKVINKTIYVIPEEIPEEMYDAEFEFKNGNKYMRLKTPSKNEFNLAEFLKSEEYGLVSLGYTKIGGDK